MAVGMWGIQPSEFWKMTPREWWLIYDARTANNKFGDLTKREVADMYAELLQLEGEM